MARITDHFLSAAKGAATNLHVVDYQAKLSSNVTVPVVRPGRVAHLNVNGEFELGVPQDPIGVISMPMYLISGSLDADVTNPGGITGSPSDKPGGYIAAIPNGAMAAYTAAAALELVSSEYVAGVAYHANDALKAKADNADTVLGGTLAKGVQYQDHIVGIVSRGIIPMYGSKHGLAFWPYNLPSIPDDLTEPAWDTP